MCQWLKPCFSPAKMFGPVFILTFLLSLSYCQADGDFVNITDANLNAMPFASSPLIVTSDPICPSDSEVIDGDCKCNPDLCELPPCDKYLNFVRNGTDTAGDCCDVYSCDNCTGDILINGTCICPEDTFLNKRGKCECIDYHKSLQNDTCVCDENKCELPLLCDKQSVPVKIKDGCCYKTICRRCPEDSYAKDYDSDELENKCVCYPCPSPKCNKTDVLSIIRRGRGVPELCCDIYECLPIEDPTKQCIVADDVYINGQSWITDNKQNCTCLNGVTVCSEPVAKEITKCFYNNTFYEHLETWIEDACTNCTCNNRNVKCIAHMCNITVSEVKKYKDCIDGELTYPHLTSWIKDTCTNCTCHDGIPDCSTESCNATKNDCPPFENCKKYCKNGFRMNKKGCKTCKCKLSEFVIEKYPLLDTYMRYHNLTEADTLALLQKMTYKEDEEVIEPTIPDCQHKDFFLIIVLSIVAFIAGVLACFALMKFCKRKCSHNYSPVAKPTDNNNLPAPENIKYISEKSPLKT